MNDVYCLALIETWLSQISRIGTQGVMLKINQIYNASSACTDVGLDEPNNRYILISCNMSTWALPECMPSQSLGAAQPQAVGHTFQAKPSCPCYNYNMHHNNLVLNTSEDNTAFVL